MTRTVKNISLIASTKLILAGMYYLQNADTLQISFVFDEAYASQLMSMSEEEFLEVGEDTIPKPIIEKDEE